MIEHYRKVTSSGVEVSFRIGQRVRHLFSTSQRVTGVVHGMHLEPERGLMLSVALDAPLVIPATEDYLEVRLHWQTAPAHEFTPFDDRDELLAELVVALQGAREWARLIAAAPDLLEALSSLASQHSESDLRADPDLHAAVKRARAAIAKATGSAA